MFPLFGGGSGEYARGLLTALAAQGHAVAITCPDARTFSDAVMVYPFRLPVRAVFNSHPELPDAVRFPELDSGRLGMLLEALEDALDDAIDASTCTTRRCWRGPRSAAAPPGACPTWSPRTAPTC
jgi:hypothetical protein